MEAACTWNGFTWMVAFTVSGFTFRVAITGAWVNLSKRGGKDGFSEGWQGSSEGFPEGKVRGKS